MGNLLFLFVLLIVPTCNLVAGEFDFKPLWDSKRKELELKNIRIEEIPFYILLLDNKTFKPLTGAKLIIKFSNKGAIILFSNERGEIFFEATEGFASINPKFIYGENVRFTILDSGLSATKETHQLLRKSDKKKMTSEGISIYYTDGQIKEAEDVLKKVERAKSVITKVIGAEPLPQEIFLDTLPPFPYVGGGMLLFSLKYPSGSMWSLTHEWTESTLTLKFLLNFYGDKDKANIRWISDGLAEYLSYFVCKDSFPKAKEAMIKGYIESLKKELHAGKENFDLTSWKSYTESKKDHDIGYPLSLYFWLRLTNCYSEKVISRFLTRIKEIPDAKTEDIPQILTGITGPEIKVWLKKAKIKQALEYLNSLQ